MQAEGGRYSSDMFSDMLSLNHHLTPARLHHCSSALYNVFMGKGKEGYTVITIYFWGDLNICQVCLS